jgi:hypothetical protein
MECEKLFQYPDIHASLIFLRILDKSGNANYNHAIHIEIVGKQWGSHWKEG